MHTVEDATQTVADLEHQRAELSAKEVELATEAKRLSYDAVLGSADAKRALTKIDVETAKVSHAQLHLRDALEEARRRLADAQRAESIDALHVNAEEALIIAARIEQRGRVISALVKELVHELKETANDTRALTALGAPSVNQQTMRLALTRTILADLREGGLDIESIPPGQRHNPGELVGGYAGQATRWAEGILRERKAA